MMAARVLLGVLAFLAAQQLSTSTSEQLGREELMNKVLWAERRNKHCKPGWADSYTELHKKMLANPSSKKLVAIPNISGKCSDSSDEPPSRLAILIFQTSRRKMKGNIPFARDCR